MASAGPLAGLADAWEGAKELRARVRAGSTSIFMAVPGEEVPGCTVKGAERNVDALLPLLGIISDGEGNVAMPHIAQLEHELLGTNQIQHKGWSFHESTRATC